MFEDLVNHVTRQHTWAHDQWQEAVRKGEEMYGKGKVKYVATADGPEPRSNGQKVYVKGISSATGQEELFEIANVIVTFEAKWAVADVSLSTASTTEPTSPLVQRPWVTKIRCSWFIRRPPKGSLI
jgi:hypothetical protein